MSLSPQQHRLLTFIAEQLRTTGVCPSTSDMIAALGVRGRGNVHQMITILEQRGYLRRLFRRRSRCIEVLRLPDDASEHWLRTASTGSIVRELMRRGIGPERGRAGRLRWPTRGDGDVRSLAAADWTAPVSAASSTVGGASHSFGAATANPRRAVAAT
jgi:SOS-response transcriptional repressor LexA